MEITGKIPAPRPIDQNHRGVMADPHATGSIKLMRLFAGPAGNVVPAFISQFTDIGSTHSSHYHGSQPHYHDHSVKMTSLQGVEEKFHQENFRVASEMRILAKI